MAYNDVVCDPSHCSGQTVSQVPLPSHFPERRERVAWRESLLSHQRAPTSETFTLQLPLKIQKQVICMESSRRTQEVPPVSILKCGLLTEILLIKLHLGLHTTLLRFSFRPQNSEPERLRESGRSPGRGGSHRSSEHVSSGHTPSSGV